MAIRFASPELAFVRPVSGRFAEALRRAAVLTCLSLRVAPPRAWCA